jgi:hypothetical protein
VERWGTTFFNRYSTGADQSNGALRRAVTGIARIEQSMAISGSVLSQWRKEKGTHQLDAVAYSRPWTARRLIQPSHQPPTQSSHPTGYQVHVSFPAVPVISDPFPPLMAARHNQARYPVFLETP